MRYICLCLVALFISGCVKAKWDYSEGDRVGTVSKLSFKKVQDTPNEVPKSWEGIAATEDNGAWEFSVDANDVAVIAALKQAISTHARVRLHYVQCNSGCDVIEKGHVTDYLVKQVTTLQ